MNVEDILQLIIIGFIVWSDGKSGVCGIGTQKKVPKIYLKQSKASAQTIRNKMQHNKGKRPLLTILTSGTKTKE
jgi:hypothetical protein